MRNQGAMAVTLATWNVCCFPCVQAPPWFERISKAQQWLNKAGVDIICLQEDCSKYAFQLAFAAKYKVTEGEHLNILYARHKTGNLISEQYCKLARLG
mmetsp:Transcript_11429/g.39743  ORF Transcript_11429/g.39743 Transcript_11429/m.39743 type:complete len:98 (-) Transcript_11429:232-525(-)